MIDTSAEWVARFLISAQPVFLSLVCFLLCFPWARRKEEETFPDLTSVLVKYLDHKEVFNKSRETALTPNDCDTDIMPDSFSPRGRLYLLSAPERTDLEKHISETSDAVLICPSLWIWWLSTLLQTTANMWLCCLWHLDWKSFLKCFRTW